ncbi:MAG: SAVED domain-containing protein [Planctomycetaceae bacterium]|nr:SAVED domain-containing protein [Planctomycetaceae bacterium]
MPNHGAAVAARLNGDDYQHLIAWREALNLLRPRTGVAIVRVEDEDALSVDDVTVQYESGCGRPNQYFQIKYHVDHRQAYSSDAMLEKRTANASSLLQKFWRTYLAMAQRSADTFELTLISNWSWDVEDKFAAVIDGQDGSIKEDFLLASAGSDLGKIRERWRLHLGATEEQFAAFVGVMRVRHGYHCWQELRDGVADRMENLGLQFDEAALLTAVGIVRAWIQHGPSDIDAGVMRTLVASHRLDLPDSAERATLVVLNTISSPRLEVEPDYALDWCDRFEGEPGRRGRMLLDAAEWNSRLLPELYALEAKIKSETTVRLVRARGAARLAPWLAFGFTFSEVAGYTVEVAQRVAGGRTEHWRSDAPASGDFYVDPHLQLGAEALIDGPSDTVAVAVGVTDSIRDDVIRDLRAHSRASALLLLAPRDGASSAAIRHAGDATALAAQVKRHTRIAVRETGAKRVLLYYCGPLSGACFIGHRMNAVAQQIVLMEDIQPGYVPTFVLR